LAGIYFRVICLTRATPKIGFADFRGFFAAKVFVGGEKEREGVGWVRDKGGKALCCA